MSRFVNPRICQTPSTISETFHESVIFYDATIRKDPKLANGSVALESLKAASCVVCASRSTTAFQSQHFLLCMSTVRRVPAFPNRFKLHLHRAEIPGDDSIFYGAEIAVCIDPARRESRAGCTAPHGCDRRTS